MTRETIANFDRWWPNEDLDWIGNGTRRIAPVAPWSVIGTAMMACPRKSAGMAYFIDSPTA